jgi:hypothetical protein
LAFFQEAVEFLELDHAGFLEFHETFSVNVLTILGNHLVDLVSEGLDIFWPARHVEDHVLSGHRRRVDCSERYLKCIST